MKTGYRPWLDIDDTAGTPWIFNLQFLSSSTDEVGLLPLEEASFEWHAYFEAWYTMTFRSVFDVVALNGLSIITNCSVSFHEVKEKLHGFFELIPYLVWCYLRDHNYEFLYEFKDVNNGNSLFGVIYGPLSLCNRDATLTMGFSNTTRNGEYYGKYW